MKIFPASRALRVLLGLFFLGLAAMLVFVVWAWEREIDPIEPYAISSPGMMFKPDIVAGGERLALIGNCISCHTSGDAAPFAGGRAVETPFGTIYSTNITPDPETGIGRWSREAFTRSMREGVDRSGRHLYPAFPYDHFTRMTAEDIDALYAYLMTREPVAADAPGNELPFPLNIRMLVAGWKLLFLREGVYQPDASRDAQWNRGAYLVEGAGHCGACHTPRNFLGAEKSGQPLAGGQAGTWDAPALGGASPAPVPWTYEQLFAYLRFGIDDAHAVPAGPMQPVVQNLARVPEEDIRAIAAYLSSFDERPASERERLAAQAIENARQKSVQAASVNASAGSSEGKDKERVRGAASIYDAACSSCHALGRAEPGGALNLALGTAVHLPSPDNLIHIVRNGIRPPEGSAGPWMPGFAGALNQDQTVALVEYIRSHFAGKPEWKDVAERVRQLSEEQQP